MAIAYATQKPAQDVTTHYTPVLLARRLLSLVPYSADDLVIDPAAGSIKPFYSNIVAHRIYCEIEEGTDFLACGLHYDWAITNPPYHLLWKFVDKASLEARKGFGFLVNINGINTLTPRRLEILTNRGFHLRALHVCTVRKWFGRYYFYIFEKRPGPCRTTWDIESW